MSLLEQIFGAGVTGCGGAGFPTHAKMAAKVEYLLLNGAECEPLLRTDRWLMEHRAEEILVAAAACMTQLEARRCVLLLKASYRREIAALEAAIAKLHSPVELHKCDSFYPAGDEQVIVQEVTGRVVPPGGIPLEVGCVVSNVATLFCVRQAMEGQPFTHKYLTVTGAVKKPLVACVPLGTTLADCLMLAGGTTLKDYGAVVGGPMMGKPLSRQQLEAEVVTKTTSGLIVLPNHHPLLTAAQLPLTHTLNRAGSACIQCSYCTQLCPRYLLGHPLEPHRIMRKLASGQQLEQQLDDPVVQNAKLCCECGVCELYACPMQLQPRQVNIRVKRLLAEQGIQVPKLQGQWLPDPQREGRKIPTKRAAVRAGVGDFYDQEPDPTLVEYQPGRVTLPLRQHIGAPSQPVVQTGQAVTVGQLIAACPEGKLGANLHASIDGVVEVTEAAIIITGKQV